MKRLAKLAACAALLNALAFGPAAAQTTTVDATAACLARGGVMNHQMNINFYGFYPIELFVCPGDRVVFRNVNNYDMRFTSSGFFANGTNLDTGRIVRGGTYGPVTVRADMNVVLRPRFADYTVNGMRDGYFVMGVAPLAYGATGRWVDTSN